MTRAAADKIIIAEMKAIIVRGKPISRILDDHVRAAILHRHPAIAIYLPAHDAETVYNKYVVPIDMEATKELQKKIVNLHGCINISMDGATINGKQKVRLYLLYLLFLLYLI